MFGDLSPQAPSDTPNGYRALAYAAQRAGCSVGDHLDAQVCPALWNQLRLWQDANQDGVAQPRELQKLKSLEVQRISLDYHESWRTDQYGNQFRYVAGLSDDSTDHRCYDVFLVVKP